MRCAPCAGATPPRCSSGSTRSSGAGPPTTGHRYPPRPSASWTTTCGDSHGSGPRSATRPSRRTGCSPGTSARSTRPGRTGGCSATAPAAATSTASPGPTSSDTRSSSTGVARRPRACRLLGLATTESAPADQPHRDAALPSPGRTMRDLQDHAARRLRPPRHSTRLGAMAGHHSQDDRCRLEHSQLGRRCTTSHPPPLPPPPPATKACLSRMHGNGHVRLYVRDGYAYAPREGVRLTV